MPQTTPSALLKVQSSSRLAFGATTAALVTLASGGTAILVSHVAQHISSPTALPGSAGLPPDTSPSPDGLVVSRPAGTGTPVPKPVDETERALRQALATRPPAARRTLTAPLVPLAPEVPPVVPPAPPVVTAPEVPPVEAPTTDPTEASRTNPAHGKHKRASSEDGTTKAGGKHAGGRHAASSPGKGKHSR